MGCGIAVWALPEGVRCPRKIDLTLSRRPELRTRALGVAASLGASRPGVLVDFGRPLFRSTLEGDLIREMVGFPECARDALVGLKSREKLGFEAGSLVEPFPLDFGRGIDESSRETGRFVDASSSSRCLILFEVTRSRSCALGSSCSFLVEGGRAIGIPEGGIVAFFGEGDC